MNILALIPARGGSKGIPCKNIAPLNKKPLIAYSIETALASQYVNRVVVSTDDEDIAAVSRDYGADVPFLRPKAIAKDNTPIAKVIDHTVAELKKCNGYIVDLLTVMYPTHPFRSVNLVDNLIQRCIKGFNPVVTAKRVIVDRSALFHQEESGLRLLPQEYDSAGPVPYTKLQGYLRVSSNTAYNEYVHILDNPVSCVDIDYEDDLKTAENIIRLGLWN